ncbi:MAG: exosome complex protein Rrp42 [Candidatus Anstonellales archaeon]
MEMTNEDILAEIKKDHIKRLLEKNERPDGRKEDEYRPITLQKNIFENAEGSALASIGKTQVLAGIKFGIAPPFADKPNEGIFSTSAEFTPIGSFMFEPGPPSPEAIELARVVDRGIRSSETFDLKSFFIEEGKVLALYLDLYVLDHDGNLFDAALLAGMAALSSTRLPKIENGEIIVGEYSSNLEIKEKVVSCTFAKFGKHILLDPSLDEERGMECRLTISTIPGFVCSMQKGGWGSFSKDEVLMLIDLAFKKGDELRNILNKG